MASLNGASVFLLPGDFLPGVYTAQNTLEQLLETNDQTVQIASLSGPMLAGAKMFHLTVVINLHFINDYMSQNSDISPF